MNNKTKSGYWACKKLWTFFFAFAFMFIFLGGVSAALLSYEKGSNGNPDLKVNLKNNFLMFPTSDIGTIELKSHERVDKPRQVLIGDGVKMWYETNFNELSENGLGEVTFIDMNTKEEVHKDYNYVYLGEENYEVPIYSCENSSGKGCVQTGTEIRKKETWLPYSSKNIPKGKFVLGIDFNIGVEETIDVIWEFEGFKLNKHAIVTSGATISYVSEAGKNYTVLTYLNNGTFNTTSNLATTSILVVGGGGGAARGGTDSGGGGGAPL